MENAERSTRASIASDMAKLVSKLKVDTEKYDLYSSAADVDDVGKIGSWIKVGGIRTYTHTHTHTGSEKLKIKKNGAAYSPYNKQENILPESFLGNLFKTESEAYGGVWHDVPIGRNVNIFYKSKKFTKSNHVIKFTSSPIFFILNGGNLSITMKNKNGGEKIIHNNGVALNNFYFWSSSVDTMPTDFVF